MRTEVIERNRGGMWPWLTQRVTAVLVIVTILVHLVLTHYVAAGKLDFNNIAARLADRAVVVNDMVLLFAVVYHALNGLRMVVLDYALSGKGGRLVFDVALWVVGIFTVVYGTWALWVWVA
jgi:succinate dehydrogenase / fumarate reductase cytochrome b subunit